MKINEKCVACKRCVPYCPVAAIKTDGGKKVWIEYDECVECNACYRSGVCKVKALEQETLEWPRSIRVELSDPAWKSSTTSGLGRGTSEMKTNDVTGKFKRGEVGFGVEFGRPGTGARLTDVQILTNLLCQANIGVKFAKKNPTTFLIENLETGDFRKDVLNERVLTIIVEFSVKSAYLKNVLEILKTTASKIDTVFSISMITKAEEDERLKNVEIVRELGYDIAPGTKVNIGIGRPAYTGSWDYEGVTQ
jgi:NAD-dependent dihydropyrimidine dehydrogenase PreA subunit